MLTNQTSIDAVMSFAGGKTKNSCEMSPYCILDVRDTLVCLCGQYIASTMRKQRRKKAFINHL